MLTNFIFVRVIYTGKGLSTFSDTIQFITILLHVHRNIGICQLLHQNNCSF